MEILIFYLLLESMYKKYKTNFFMSTYFLNFLALPETYLKRKMKLIDLP